MPKLCPNITFPHQQDFFPIRSVTKSSTARFSHENLVEKFKIFVQDFVPIRTALIRAYINDVRKIKIGKNQNQNWVLIGRGSKPPDYASLFFGNRCQTKEVPRDLMFIFRKINIGGVHLIEGFPNATRQRPEHSRVTTAARRQTAPPHNTHNFCWHGPRQRSHGEGKR